jgi:hypothetical protein
MRVLITTLGAVAFLAACNPSADTDNPAVATDEAIAERAADSPSAGASSFTQEQARERIVAQGYTDPSALTQAADGTWSGQATRNGQTVQVTVDYQGNVTPQSGAGSPAPATQP